MNWPFSGLRRAAKAGRQLSACREATALAHEVYRRMVDQSQQKWQNRSHFFGVAAHLMRLILVDHARKSRAGKRGGGANKVELKEAMAASPERPGDVVSLDGALLALARPRNLHRDRGQGPANCATLVVPRNEGWRGYCVGWSGKFTLSSSSVSRRSTTESRWRRFASLSAPSFSFRSVLYA